MIRVLMLSRRVMCEQGDASPLALLDSARGAKTPLINRAVLQQYRKTHTVCSCQQYPHLAHPIKKKWFARVLCPHLILSPIRSTSPCQATATHSGLTYLHDTRCLLFLTKLIHCVLWYWYHSTRPCSSSQTYYWYWVLNIKATTANAAELSQAFKKNTKYQYSVCI